MTSLCLYIISVSISQAQIKTSVSYSNPWLNKAKELNKVRKDLKKTSLDILLKTARYHSARDSLSDLLSPLTENLADIPVDDLVIIARLTESKAKYQQTVDSLLRESDAFDADHDESISLYEDLIDSCQVVLDLYTKSYLGDPLAKIDVPFDSSTIAQSSFDSTFLNQSKRDSILQNQLSSYLELYARSVDEVNEVFQQENSFLQEQQKLISYEADFNKYRDTKNLKSNLEKLSQSELIENNETLSKAHKQIAKNKRKYLSLPSSAHLEQGTKHTSLDHLTFWERFKIGGNLRISQRKYFDIDFSPSIAYMFNTKWSVGSEFVIRSQFGGNRRWYRSFSSDTYGGRLFADYFVIKSFFAHAEYERIYKPALPGTSEKPDRMVVPGAFAGVGKTFDLGKQVKGRVIVQYNFIYDQDRAAYPGPWVVRFGFEVSNRQKNND